MLLWRLALAGLLLLTGCGDSADGRSEDAGNSERTSSTESSVEKRHELVATFASNRGRLSVVEGDRIRVFLAGPSWTFDQPSDPQILKQSGDVEVLPASADCANGGDCGGATAYFDVIATGESEILATRADCVGVEPACETGPGSFRMTVVSGTQ